MRGKKKRADWSVFKRTKAEGARFDGYYVRWVDADGVRRTTYAGRTKKAAREMLKRKGEERDAATATTIAMLL